MSFTLNLFPNQKSIIFADQTMDNFMTLYNLAYKRELCFVLHELTINAIEAMRHAGKIKAEIQVDVAYKSGKIRITVIDTAGGIPKENWEDILSYHYNMEMTFAERGRGLFFVKNMVDELWFDNLSEAKFLVGISKKVDK